MIFGNAKLLYVASLFAYLVGQLLDIWIFGVLKKLTRGKHLWFRAAGSTVISQLVDSFLVTYVALSLGKTLTNQIPASLPDVFSIAMTGYSLKFVLAMLITPLLYATRSFLQKNFNLVPVPVDYDESKSK